MSEEFKPWEKPDQKIEDALPERKTVDASEGLNALKGIRERVGGLLDKDDALKISMYVPNKVERKDGDTWTDDNGKQWERKGGTNRSITKLQSAKRPWWCPKCSHLMKGKADDKMWIIRGMCHRCVIQIETQMRVEGKWDRYERSLMMRNAMAMAREGIAELEGYRDMVGNPQMHFADGRFEEWDVNVDGLKEGLQSEIGILEHTLTGLQKEWTDNGFEEFEWTASVQHETESAVEKV